MKRVYRAAIAGAACVFLRWPASVNADATASPALIPPTTQPASDAIGINPDPSRYLFEDQLLPGMKGYGLTVMHGGKIEKFDVEIIDVIRNFSPGNNAILVRCSGLGLEHSGIIAGMSGSPVFMQDKMIGAVAYGWGLSKDPIGGVQPIRQMLSIRTVEAAKATTSAGRGGGARWAENDGFARQASALPGWKTLAASLARRVGSSGRLDVSAGANAVDRWPEGMRPLVSPLMVGGASASTLELLRHELAGTGLVPVASGSAGATAFVDGEHPIKELGGLADVKAGEIQLEPGAAIAVPLVTGDMDLSAIGTVTEVRDGKVYAFGHSFMGDGVTSLPIATSYIYTIMPNLSQSFKMGTSIVSDGTLVSDEQTGIVGLRGKAPPTVPITFTIKNTDGLLNKTYHYRLAPHPRMTAEMLGAILNETLIAQRTLPQQFTAEIKAHMVFDGTGGQTSITVSNLGASAGFNPLTTLLPVAILADNPFENLKLKEMSLDATIENTNRSGTINSITVDRLIAAPGDEVTAVAEVSVFQQGVKRIPLTIKIPKDAPDGDYQLGVGSSQLALMQEVNYAPQRFDPENIQALTDAVQRILNYRPDHLYATFQMNVSGASVGGRELKNLPPSRMALYTSEQRTDAVPLFSVLRTDVDTGDVLADGGQLFTIHVDRDADRRYFEPKHGGPNVPGSAQRAPRVPVTAPAASAPAQDPDN